MTESEIEKNIRQKFIDAGILLKNDSYANSIYLFGYCIELALKLSTIKHLGWSELRGKKNYESLWTHDLNILLAFSGKEYHVKTTLSAYWSIVVKWNEAKRYEDPTTASIADATNMQTATKIITEDICNILL